MKKIFAVIILILIAGLCAVYFIFQKNVSSSNVDAVLVNDIVMTAMEGDEQTLAGDMTERLKQAFDDMDEERNKRDAELRLIIYAFMGAFVLVVAFLLLHINHSILKPFKKLKRFAQNVASGNLDIPLEMDKGGSFGAFTESFDLMRSELLRSKEAEKQANKSKKELVASLSHDIKTPLASIKAVSELMLVTAQDEHQCEKIQIINAKTDQIGLLINNLFSATLEELQELKVSPCEISSRTIYKLFDETDFNRKVSLDEIPECMVIADSMRLAQVFDNIISNSYKYSGTRIEVTTELAEDMLWIDIADFGSGVSSKELPLLSQKFFRGENAKNKSGSGLGLYISKYLMKKMSGRLCCENRTNGFAVRLALKLA